MRNIIFILFILVCGETFSQTTLTDFLKTVEENNYTLITARELKNSQQDAAKTGVLPADPQVSYAYLVNGDDNLQELEVSQTFDFPTVYLNRKKVSKQKQAVSESAYQQLRQQVLLQAKQAYIQFVFLNKKLEVIRKRKENTEKLAKAVLFRFELGDATIVQQQKVKLESVSANTAYHFVKNEIAQQKQLLQLITGNKQTAWQATEYPVLPQLSLDSLLQLYRTAPKMNVQENNRQQAQAALKLAKAQWLPSFTLGYAHEKTPAEDLSGIRVGMSIPLWEKSNTVKTAKAKLAYREAAVAEQLAVQEIELKQKYNNLHLCTLNMKAMYDALEENNVPDFLLKALKEGELSLIDYLNEIGFFYDKKLEWLETQMRYQQNMAELYKVLL